MILISIVNLAMSPEKYLEYTKGRAALEREDLVGSFVIQNTTLILFIRNRL